MKALGGIGQVAKAIYGAIIAGLSGLAAVLVGGASLADVSAGQWVSIVLAALIAGGGVYKLGPPVVR